MPTNAPTSDHLSINMLDIIGFRSSIDPSVLDHVAMAAEGVEHGPNPAEIDMFHMAPPIHRSVETAELVGTVPLDGEELWMIECFIETHEYRTEVINESVSMDSLRHYVVAPHYLPPTPDSTLSRFSCAGYVQEAYLEAGLELVKTGPGDLPAVNWDVLRNAFPAAARAQGLPRIANHIGLPGEGPWEVLLPSYLLHSCNRSTSNIRQEPIRATHAEIYFS